MEYLIMLGVLFTIYRVCFNKKGWSFPTKEDCDWAESHKDLIERNS